MKRYLYLFLYSVLLGLCTQNIDICGGYPSLIMKMLYYSETGLVSLLPCKPEDWKNRSLKEAAMRGGILLKELTWNNNGGHATLISKIDQTVKLKVYGQDKGEIELKAGLPQVISL